MMERGTGIGRDRFAFRNRQAAIRPGPVKTSQCRRKQLLPFTSGELQAGGQIDSARAPVFPEYFRKSSGAGITELGVHTVVRSAALHLHEAVQVDGPPERPAGKVVHLDRVVVDRNGGGEVPQ